MPTSIILAALLMQLPEGAQIGGGNPLASIERRLDELERREREHVRLLDALRAYYRAEDKLWRCINEFGSFWGNSPGDYVGPCGKESRAAIEANNSLRSTMAEKLDEETTAMK